MERKTFDIARPSRSNPSATSRPIIVGHQPMMRDPMMRQNDATSAQTTQPPAQLTNHTAKVIEVTDEIRQDLGVSQPAAAPEAPPAQESAAPIVAAQEAPLLAAEVVPEAPTTPEATTTPQPQANVPVAAADALGQTQPAQTAAAAAPEAAPQVDLSHIPHVPVSHMPTSGPGKLKRAIVWLLVLGFLAAFGAYLAVDAGLIKSNANLPVHIFSRQNQ